MFHLLELGELMAKRAPDQTISFRIELQEHERKLLEDYIRSQTIKDVANAIDTISSFENAYIIVTLIEILTGREILPGTPNDIYKLIDYLKDYFKQNLGKPENSEQLNEQWELFKASWGLFF